MPSFQFSQRIQISDDHVFASTDLSFAFVNLKPLVPGHILISSRRVVQRFGELGPQEVADMWQLAHRIGPKLESYYQAKALTMAIQDGRDAGQTVPHVHIHVLPRKKGDFANNDDIYDALDSNSKEYASSAEKLDLDKERSPRTNDEMSAEAAAYRELLSL